MKKWEKNDIFNGNNKGEKSSFDSDFQPWQVIAHFVQKNALINNMQFILHNSF